MPNSLVKPLYERLLRSFPADQSYTRSDWKEDAMPDPVRHYLDHLLRHHGRREARRLRRARTEWVDYDHPEMEQAIRTFFETMEGHTHVPQDEWADTLHTATRRTTTYLVRPVPTLTSFIFEGHDAAVSASQVQWRMRFFKPYSYLREAVQAYAKKRALDSFEAGAFEQVLRRVDEHMTADFDADQWLRLLGPLFEVARRATDREQVPLSLLRTFFEEKNASRIVERLAAYEREEDATAGTPETLRRVIEAQEQAGSSERRPAPERSADPSLDASPGADLPGVADAVQTPSPEPQSGEESTGRATPLWKRFQHGRPRRHGGTEKETEDSSQPLWTQFRQGRSSSSSSNSESGLAPSPSEEMSEMSAERSSAVSSGQERNLASLEREVLGTGHPSHRDVYVQKLFGGDEAAYRRVLERLRTTESWSDASQVIAADVFRAHKVNIYSDAAVHFTNAVEATFQEE